MTRVKPYGPWVSSLTRCCGIAAAILIATLATTRASWAVETVPTWLGEAYVISGKNVQDLGSIIEVLNREGGVILLQPDVPAGPLPMPPANGRVRVIDLRYGGGVNLIRGNHPRLEGKWPQYTGLETRLGRNLTVSDVVTPATAPFETWKGQPMQTGKAHGRGGDPYEYGNNHAHYQNLLSEVWNFAPHVNAVSIWGDAGAFYPDAKAWGGFFSARAWPLHWMEYVAQENPVFSDEDFDAQLIGIEVDVLNNGKSDLLIDVPGRDRPWAKVGVQVVGFGKRNTAAIEIRTEDTDVPRNALRTKERRGSWNYGIIVNNSLHADSTLIMGAFDEARRGIDLGRPLFKEGAIRFRSERIGHGIVINNGNGGQLYADADDRMVLAVGKRGLRIVTADSERELMSLGPNGSVSFAGSMPGGGGMFAGSWTFHWIVLALCCVMAFVSMGFSWVALRRMRASNTACPNGGPSR